MASATSSFTLEEGVLEFQFMIHTLSKPAILHDIPLDVTCLNLHLDEWYSHIYQYLKDESFPEFAT